MNPLKPITHRLPFTYVAAISLSLGLALPAIAADSKGKGKSESKPAPQASPSPGAASSNEWEGAEQVNVDQIKQKYWAGGDESSMGVVQNRLYSKEHKFELSLMGGIISTDPFIDVRALGGAIGFHFSEYLGLRFLGWKEYVSPSSALSLFQEKTGGAVNNNEPRSYLGSEVTASFLYGKLSLIGQAIIYFDMHLTGGLGFTNTESGRYFTPSLGVGQQIFLARFLALRLDYRAMTYSEQILEKNIPTKLGTPIGSRTNWTHTFMLGFDFLFGVFK